MLRLAVLMIIASLLSSCGLKGNLYLPDKSATPVVTRSATQSSSSSSSSSTAKP
jgi:predicted small lipoprotein YifL